MSTEHHTHAGPAPAGPPSTPGEPLSLGQKVLNTGTSALQSFGPLSNVCQHVCAFHCYAHDTTRQVRSYDLPASSAQHLGSQAALQLSCATQSPLHPPLHTCPHWLSPCPPIPHPPTHTPVCAHRCVPTTSAAT